MRMNGGSEMMFKHFQYLGSYLSDVLTNEYYRIKKKYLHKILINLQMTYDKTLKEVLSYVLTKKTMPHKYINILQDMYEEA